MPTQSQPETTETETPATGTAVTEGETDEAAKAAAAAAEGGEQQAEGEGAAAEGEKQPEQTEEEKAAAEKEATEWEIKVKAAGEKYAKEQISQANRTMAAARRAERAIEETKTKNVALAKENEVLSGFVEQLRKEPMSALGRLGFKTFKAFTDHVLASGGDHEPTEDERIESAVRKALEAHNAPRAKAEQEAAVAESQKAVFAYVDENKEKYTRTATRSGKRELWDAITNYVEKHGTCPDEAVIYLADQVERELRADFGDPVSPSPGAKQGKPAAKGAAPAASTSGTSLAGKPMSGAPAAKKYSDDPDERRTQVNAELRAEGLL